MLIPDRICTLSLVSTAAGLFRTSVSNKASIHVWYLPTSDFPISQPEYPALSRGSQLAELCCPLFDMFQGFVENLRNRANLFIPKSIDSQIESVKYNLYTPSWLSSPDALEHVKEPFPTNGDRFAANELWKRSHPEYFAKPGFILQAIAAGWHYKSPTDLHKLANAVGKRRIMVVHGTKDRMITFPHGVVLWRGLEKGEGKTGKETWLGIEEEPDVWAEGEIEKRYIKDQAHVIPIEMRKEFHSWVEALIERGEGLNRSEA